MATVIYDDDFGARTTKIFGCSLKTISVQMGFNSQPIVFSITVVQDADQVFTLDQYNVRSIQSVSFGELSILGIVQSWEKTTVSAQGSGIYVVRLIDCRIVLDSKKIVNLETYYPGTSDVVTQHAVSNLTKEGCTKITRIKRTFPGREPITVEGATFARFIDLVESTPIEYSDNIFEVDMSELSDLTNMDGEGVQTYFVEGKVRSIVSTITDFCNSVGAEWWVEANRKSVVDDTVIIKIKVIRRLDRIGNPNVLEMDALAALHDDRVISRKDGYELNDVVTHEIVWGGMKQKLYEAHGIAIEQFWGWDTSGNPLASPSYVIPGEPQDRRIPITIEDMENVINGDLDGSMDRDQLSALKQYVYTFWGKKFCCTLRKDIMSDSGQDLPFYPEITSVGWWEGYFQPQGSKPFSADVFSKLTTFDGRWGPFVQLSDIFTTGSGTIESPRKANYIQWAPTTQNSVNFITSSDESYMQCKLNQYGRYVIISLPVSLTRYYMDKETGAFNRDRFTRENTLSSAYIPLIDRAVHYGPWSNFSLSPNSTPLPGRTEATIDRALVPWAFGANNITHDAAMEQLAILANQKMNIFPHMPTLSIGQLEVAGIPAVNIGQAVGLGGSITDIFVRFDVNGVTTRYVSNLYTRELGDFKRQKQRELEHQEMKEERETDEECPIDEEEEEIIPQEELEEKLEPEVTGPTQEAMEYVYQKPEGGMGVVSVKEGGPFYSVRRLSYADVDPGTFAGGIDITGSYFLAEWNNVRNLAEPENSPGLIPIGTRVTINIFSESDERGPYLPYMEQTPQVFTPPVVAE